MLNVAQLAFKMLALFRVEFLTGKGGGGGGDCKKLRKIMLQYLSMMVIVDEHSM
jgi:hypothetical protein